MADDIDELLDEIESKYVQRADNFTKPTNPKYPSQLRAVAKDDELQSALDDIFSLPDPITVEKVTSSKTTVEKRCFPTYLGGSRYSMGHTSTLAEKACDTLRCLRCDFKVSWFDDFTWKSDIDYLFLRNNMPDFRLLKSKLNPNKGSRAYACQCQWRSIHDLIDLKADSALKWVCGKHFNSI